MSRFIPIFAVLLLGAAFAAPASAKLPKERSYPKMDQCLDQPEARNGVTAALLDCTNAEIDRQVARMNNALAKLSPSIPKKPPA